MRTTGLRLSTAASKKFVPASPPPPSEMELERFRNELAGVDRLLVLTGAGVSTESGIPDYRSPRERMPTPTTIQQFLLSPYSRRRYWARNFVAWPAFRAVKPNATHFALANAEHSGRLHWLITQNVDTLHHKAGSTKFTELHGTGHVVKCIKCNESHARDDFQKLIASMNPNWSVEACEIAPDGDVVIPEHMINKFQTPHCNVCGPEEGIFKTDVVFFGDNVKKSVVEFCSQKVRESDGTLVLGSSLTVFSGYRFVRQTIEQNKPLFVVNIGDTRVDNLCPTPHRLRCRCSEVVPTFFPPR